tara:strand:- start:4285 stop:4614 length:330 start_codon:yes stop_codon:yes gene_type:complete
MGGWMSRASETAATVTEVPALLVPEPMRPAVQGVIATLLFAAAYDHVMGGGTTFDVIQYRSLNSPLIIAGGAFASNYVLKAGTPEWAMMHAFLGYWITMRDRNVRRRSH